MSVYEGKKGTNVCKGKKDMKKISLWGKKKSKTPQETVVILSKKNLLHS